MVSSPYATKLTRDIMAGEAAPSRNMWNGKPFRTRLQKVEARRRAEKMNDGAWRSSAPVSWHPTPRGNQA